MPSMRWKLAPRASSSPDAPALAPQKKGKKVYAYPRRPRDADPSLDPSASPDALANARPPPPARGAFKPRAVPAYPPGQSPPPGRPGGPPVVEPRLLGRRTPAPETKAPTEPPDGHTARTPMHFRRGTEDFYVAPDGHRYSRPLIRARVMHRYETLGHFAAARVSWGQIDALDEHLDRVSYTRAQAVLMALAAMRMTVSQAIVWLQSLPAPAPSPETAVLAGEMGRGKEGEGEKTLGELLFLQEADRWPRQRYGYVFALAGRLRRTKPPPPASAWRRAAEILSGAFVPGNEGKRDLAYARLRGAVKGKPGADEKPGPSSPGTTERRPNAHKKAREAAREAAQKATAPSRRAASPKKTLAATTKNETKERQET